MPRWRDMDPDDVLAQYPEEFLACRGRHPWPRSGEGVVWVMVGANQAERRVLCPSCGSTQVKLVDVRTMRRIKPQATIRYVRGYQTTGTGLTLVDFESTAYRRDFEAATADNRIFTDLTGGNGHG